MSDGVSIGGGGISSPAVARILEAFASSAGVPEQIEQFQKAKGASEKALAQLNLGKAAQAAFDDASAKSAAAESALAEAKKAATALVNKANADAASLLSEAGTQRDKMMAEITKARSDHEDWAASVKADLAGKQKALDASLASAQVDKDAAAKLAAEARKAVAAAKSAKDDHDTLVAQMKTDADKLQQALGALIPAPTQARG